MSTITTINASDVVADSRAVINTNFSNLNTDKVETLSDLGITVSAADINQPIMTGVIQMWPVNTTPDGWLLCRGQAVSRTTYSALYTLLGDTYGAGDGSTTFNLPDLQGNVPVGYDSTQSEFDALGETGGAKTHTLTEAEMPAHTHDAATGNFLVNDPNVSDFSDSGTANGTVASATASTGGGGAHNNLQPYIALNFIIKT